MHFHLNFFTVCETFFLFFFFFLGGGEGVLNDSRLWFTAPQWLKPLMLIGKFEKNWQCELNVRDQPRSAIQTKMVWPTEIGEFVTRKWDFIRVVFTDSSHFVQYTQSSDLHLWPRTCVMCGEQVQRALEVRYKYLTITQFLFFSKETNSGDSNCRSDHWLIAAKSRTPKYWSVTTKKIKIKKIKKKILQATKNSSGAGG